jgi:hypothetical protein
MSEPVLTRLRELAEPLVALSTSHLSPATRQLLQEDQLSVNAYPTLTGGFVYVGVPRYDTPLEADLARLFELADPGRSPHPPSPSAPASATRRTRARSPPVPAPAASSP